ncbi:MAG: alpha/beta fold hydrolase [Planctomycetes bacterium]|nr:alpha/beta fold hydrolase [Planctomycetota bacterium]
MQVASGYAKVLEEDIAFPSAGFALHGILTLTDEIPSDCAAITLHGWAGTGTGPHRLLVTLGRLLAERGVPTLRFDFSGRGRSEGDARQANLDGMIEDTCAAMDFLRAKGFRRISLIGICSGGNVAIGAATLRPGLTADLVCLSTLPFSPPTPTQGREKAKGYFKQYLRKACSTVTWKRLFHGDVSISRVTRVIKRSLQEDQDQRRLKDSSRDIMGQFKNFPRTANFIYGGNDPEAPEAFKHYQQFCEEHAISATFAFINGSNHNFYSLNWAKDAREKIVAAIMTDLA